MGCKAKACADCARKCLLIHGKKTNSSHVITSFFKVMIGDQYSEVLFLPPKFAPTVSALIDKRTFLEDSSGQQWEVAISNLSGAFAFQQGWNAFSLHHKLEIGDFVVFDYIIGSHFVVKIYNKTGCEKLDFSENRNQRKRARTTRNSTFKDGQCYKTYKDSMNKQGSIPSAISGSDVEISQRQCEVNNLEKKFTKIDSNDEDCNGRPQSVSKAEFVEEPYYMIDRDLDGEQREYRCPIFDLPSFEMLGNNSGTDTSKKIAVGDEIYPHHADASVRSQIEDFLVKKDSVDEELSKGVLHFDASDIEMMEKNNAFHMIERTVTVSDKISYNSNIAEHLLFTTAVASQKEGGNSSNSSTGVFKRRHIAKEKGKAQSKSWSEIDQQTVSPKECTSLTNSNQVGRLKFCGKFGMLPEVTKIDCGQSSEMTVGENATNLVKIETFNLAPISSPTAVSISCVIESASQPFLELPTCLPTTSFNQRSKKENKVVLLRDPDMRLWSVLYHERSEFKMLTTGWEAFCKANNVQPGDECVFGVENEPEGIYGVNILRK